jgi:Cu(I)/Ag(I) efflux system membrane fusion protein
MLTLFSKQKRKSGSFVVINKGNGQFQPRRVKTGIVSADRTEIVDGLVDGELVVVSSQFLIDSESSLRESFRKLNSIKSELSHGDGAEPAQMSPHRGGAHAHH